MLKHKDHRRTNCDSRKDENFGIDGNIEGQIYENIGGNIDIDKTLKEMVEIYKKKYEKF